MCKFALSPTPKLLLTSAVVAFLALASMPSHAQPDPPAQAGRLSYITGNVSIQPSGSDDWGHAVPNDTEKPDALRGGLFRPCAARFNPLSLTA
jgi:hypothetical protein